MYTIYPLHHPDPAFPLYFFIALWFLVIGGGIIYLEERKSKLFVGSIIAIELVAQYFLYNALAKEPVPYANVPVQATFVEFVTEVHVNTKYQSRILYGRFQVPEGIVAVTMELGVPTSPNVTLYRN